MQANIKAFESAFPSLGEKVYIDPSAVVIGNVTLSDDVSVWPNAVIRGDVNSIFIGKASNIQDAVILHATHDGPFSPGGKGLYLGDQVTVGHQAVLHACHVESCSLIGIGALILDGAHIETRVMVAAGSVVPPGKRLLSGYLYLGNPARPVRHLSSDELNNLSYSAQHYVQLKNKYLSGLSHCRVDDKN